MGCPSWHVFGKIRNVIYCPEPFFQNLRTLRNELDQAARSDLWDDEGTVVGCTKREGGDSESHRAQPGSAALPNSLVCRIVSAACPHLLLHSSHNNLLHHPSFSARHSYQSHVWMSTNVEARAVPTPPFLSEVFPAALSVARLVFC